METNEKHLQIAKFLLKIEKKAYKIAKKIKIDVHNKGSKHDLVTSWDYAIEKFLNSKLNEQFPNIKIVSEEFNTTAKAEGTYFVVDPVDGTVNFANKIPLWGIQMAYVENDEIVASAIFIPSQGEYLAAKGFGAFKNGARFFVEKKDLRHCIINIGNVKAEVKTAAALYSSAMQYRHIGSACVALAWMAEGRFGIYVVDATFNVWDIYPGLLLCQESGCVSEYVGNRFVIVNDEKIMKFVKKLLQKFD